MKYALIIIGILFLAGGALAQSMPCGDRKTIQKRLNEIYKEFVIGSGVAENGAMVEVYISENGTFTITLTGFQKTCLAVTGKDWIFISPSVEELEL